MAQVLKQTAHCPEQHVDRAEERAADWAVSAFTGPSLSPKYPWGHWLRFGIRQLRARNGVGRGSITAWWSGRPGAMIPLTRSAPYCCVNQIVVRQEARPVLRTEVYSEFEPYTET